MTVNIERYIRPSSAERLSLCPGSAVMQAAVEEAGYGEKTSPEATTGTLIHECVALAIRGWSVAQESGEHGQEWPDIIAMACEHATQQGLDTWSVWCVRATIEFYRDLIAKYEIAPENVLPEQALDMEAFGFRRPGTADLVLLDPFKRVIIVDIKAGYVDQGDADEHDQLAVYSTAAAATYSVKEVVVYIWQPRAEKNRRATAASFDAAALLNTKGWSLAVTNLARSHNPELAAGYAQCKYCRALAFCPAAKEAIMNAQEALETLGMPLDADGRGALADAAKLAEKFGEAGKDIVKEALMAGQDATGWRLGTPRAIRTVANVPAALQKLSDAGFGNEAGEALSMSPSKLPDAAAELIADQITEKLSTPPLTQIKGRKS